jgi:hypothetical protein
MKHSARVLHWESTRDATRCGIEITGLSAGDSRLEAELDRVLGRLGDIRPAFVLAAFGAGKPPEVAHAISGACELFFNARVCVAIDEETLYEIDRATLSKTSLGIVLDRVDASTPLTAISAEVVDAIRFDDSFVRKSSTDARSSCVMEAMLRLANDLGLATLGSTPRRNESLGFDYVLKPVTSK